MWIRYDEYDVKVNYTPRLRGRNDREPEDCYPPDDEECEVEEVHEHGTSVLENGWPQFDYDKLCKLCRDRIQADMDDAADARADEARERRMEKDQ